MKTVAMIPIKLNNECTSGKNIKRFAEGKPLNLDAANIRKTQDLPAYYFIIDIDYMEDFEIANVVYMNVLQNKPAYFDP